MRRVDHNTIATINLGEVLVLDRKQQFRTVQEDGVGRFKPNYVSWTEGVIFDGTHYYFRVQVKDKLKMLVNGKRVSVQKFFRLQRHGVITFELSSFKQRKNLDPLFEFRLGDFWFNEYELRVGAKYYVRRHQSHLTGKRPVYKGENACMLNRLSEEHIKKMLRPIPKIRLKGEAKPKKVDILDTEDVYLVSEEQLKVLDTMVKLAPHLFGEHSELVNLRRDTLKEFYGDEEAEDARFAAYMEKLNLQILEEMNS